MGGVVVGMVVLTIIATIFGGPVGFIVVGGGSIALLLIAIGGVLLVALGEVLKSWAVALGSARVGAATSWVLTVSMVVLVFAALLEF